MGGFIRSDVKRVETIQSNTKVNKEVLDTFKGLCKRQGYPLNVMIETFMQQYTNGRFKINEEEVAKWKGNKEEIDTLSTTLNKEIYSEFRNICRGEGFFAKHVITAFMEEIINNDYSLEFVNTNKN